jgi:hypothetical protein
MPVNGIKVGFSMLCVLILLATSACVSTRLGGSANTEPVVEKVENHDNGWWKAAFLVTWPEDEEPLWHVDLLIAHRVIWPVLRRFDHHMELWRFHRRVVRDEKGHRFSFIFYCSAPTAQKVFDAIRADHDLRAMKAFGTILEDVYDDTSEVRNPHIEDMSDSGWSEAIRKTWPYFIKGVSETWLDLVVHLAQERPDLKTVLSVEQMVTFYKDIDSLVEALWQKEGGHAFLHHLNGIFGYKEVIVYDKRLMTF